MTPPRPRAHALLLALLVTLGACSRVPRYTVAPTPRNTVDDRLFGAFFEKASWGGEIGADVAVDVRTGEVAPEIVEYMRWMDIPTVRFPGGTAIDYYPWWRLIDSMPGHHATRPRNAHYKPEEVGQSGIVSSDGRMGLHEFMALCREIDAEPLLVVNVGDAYFEKRPLEEAAERLGGDFVRYCNDASGPWAELRAANGSPAPFGVRLWQIGNETWGFDGWEAPEDGARLAAAIDAYARAMRAADPDANLELIADGSREIIGAMTPEQRARVDYLAFHSYVPWGIGEVVRDGRPADSTEVSEADVYRALASAPRVDSVVGRSYLRNYALDSAAGPLAVTEWNLNGWFAGDAKWAEPANRHLAFGLGAGSYLNALLRASDRVRLANQSMLVGVSWDITGIRVDTTGRKPAILYPTAVATGLYSRHHGDAYHEITGIRNPRTRPQPLRLSSLAPSARVLEQDVVVTADAEAFYVHVVNRGSAVGHEIEVAFPERVDVGRARRFTLAGTGATARAPYGDVVGGDIGGGVVAGGVGRGRRSRFRKTLAVTLPPRSVSVVRVPRG